MTLTKGRDTSDTGGGVIYSQGTLTLQGDLVVENSRGKHAGGVQNSGTLVLKDTVSIRNNRADFGGGGVRNFHPIILEGNASIRNNTAKGHGGVSNFSSLTMRDSAVITGNQGSVGGVYNYEGATFSGADYDDQGEDNIFGNTPSDVAFQDSTPPSVTFSDLGELTVDEAVTLTGTAADNVKVTGVTLFEGQTELGAATLSGSGSDWSYAYTPQQAGEVTLRVVATDAAGNSTEASQTVTVVQPALWPVQFGTSASDYANSVSTDASGNVYVSGFTGGTLPSNSSAGSYSDAFIAKFDSNGNQ